MSELYREGYVVLGKIHVYKKQQLTFDEFNGQTFNVKKPSLKETIIDMVKNYEGLEEVGKKNTYAWKFGDIHIDSKNGEDILYARLGKIKVDGEELEYDETSKSFKPEHNLINKPEVYSNFLIHFSKHIIVIEEKSKLKYTKFINIFSKMFEDYYKRSLIVEIDEIMEPLGVFKVLDSCDKLMSATITVSPSNPEDEEDFRRLDELLKQTGSEKTRIEFSDKDGSGLKHRGTIVGEAIALANSGYGHYLLKIIERGIVRKISSKNYIYRRFINYIDEPEQVIDKFYRVILEYLQGKK